MSFVRAGLISALMAIGLQAHAAPPGVEAQSGYWRQSNGEQLFTHVRDDAPGQSNCTGACSEVWSPILAGPDAAPDAGWTVEPQADGRRIWVFDGKPVYRLIDPEKRKYKGSSALWLPSRASHWLPEGVAIDDRGFLVMKDGRKLKTPSHRTCGTECKARWLPFEAPLNAVGRQDWTIARTSEGTSVWSYDKSPIYIENPNAQPITPPPDAKLAVLSPAMILVSTSKLPPVLAPIALEDGAFDMYDPVVAPTPQRAPGWQAPKYPTSSLRAREQGLVKAQVCVGPTGAVTSHAIAASSGHPALDAATTSWLAGLKFIPGQVNGVPAKVCGYTIEFAWDVP